MNSEINRGWLLLVVALAPLGFCPTAKGDASSIVPGGDDSPPVIGRHTCTEISAEGDIQWLPCIEFSPPGGTYHTQVVVRASIRYEPPTVVRYTLDGRDPTEADPLLLDGQTIPLEGNTTVKARAFIPNTLSFMERAEYVVTPFPPEFEPPPGSTVTNGTLLRISSSTEGAQLFFAFGFILPLVPLTAAGGYAEYAEPIPLIAPSYVRGSGAAVSVTAWAEKPGLSPAYSIATYEFPAVAQPVFDPSPDRWDEFPTLSGTSRHPPSRHYYEPISVSIFTGTEGAVLHYTLDGSMPSPDSDIYSKALQVRPGTIVRVIAVKEGMVPHLNQGIYHSPCTYFRATNPLLEDDPGYLECAGEILAIPPSLRISVRNQRVHLEWPDLPDGWYNVEISSNLTDWVDAGEVDRFPVAGGTFSFVIPVAEDGKPRFFRIRRHHHAPLDLTGLVFHTGYSGERLSFLTEAAVHSTVYRDGTYRWIRGINSTVHLQLHFQVPGSLATQFHQMSLTFTNELSGTWGRQVTYGFNMSLHSGTFVVMPP
jgi:hypothetical protein